MDKKEYQEKLDEISRLIATEEYEQAAGVADSIDWKRVRNVQTLVMVSEIYEAVGRYEDSKELLLRAYRRSPLGRTVLYRLVECTIQLGQFDEAIEYYSEYVQAAPHDNNRFILKYKIYKGRGASLDEQISILQDYLEQEYNEKWVYELAKLQIQADHVQEGLSTCDDLVLWFHSGKYVIKALELKKKYAPLTPKQQEIYDNRFEEEDTDYDEYGENSNSYLREAQIQAEARRAEVQQEAIKSELAADISHAAQMEKAKEEISQKAQAAQKAVEETAAQSEKVLADKADEIASEAGLYADAEDAPAQERTEAAGDAPQAEEEAAGEAAGEAKEAADEAPQAASQDAAAEAPETTAQEAAAEESVTALPEEAAKVPGTDAAQNAAEETAAQAEKVPADKADETAAGAGLYTDAGTAPAGGIPEERTEAEDAPEADEAVSKEQLQEDMVRSMREIVSGVAPKEEMDAAEAALNEAIDQSKEDQENAVAARGAENVFNVPQSAASQKRQAGRLTIDDILLSMGDQGERVKEVTGGSVLPASEEAMHAEAALRESAEIAEKSEPMEAETKSAEPEDTAAAEIPAAEAPAAEVQEKVREGSFEELASLPPVDHVEYTEEIAAAKTKKLPVEEIRKLHEAYLNDSASQAAAEAVLNAAGAAEKAAEEAEAEAAAQASAQVLPEETASVSAIPEETVQEEAPDALKEASSQENAAKTGAETPEEGGEAVSEEDTQESVTNAPEADAPEAAVPEAQAEEKQEALKEDSAAADESGQAAAGPGEEGGSAAQMGAGVQKTVEVEKSAQEPTIYGSRPMLQEYQKDLFRGFTGVGTLEEQIANAIRQAEDKQGDRTSRTGNILILGAHGSGKTTIATGIAKAIAEDRGTHSIKMARIYAADLNRKDIAATIAKIAGGMLIVEEAGDLDDAIVDQLTTAMEFRTDGLIVILEDEQRYIHDLLMRHPRFTMKFTAQIYIPQYTNEELVNFGSIYAQSKDYVFSDKAMAALYDRIEAAAQMGDEVSVTNVVELVDRAIHNANKFFRRIGSSKKRYDEMDRIILKEKDFR